MIPPYPPLVKRFSSLIFRDPKKTKKAPKYLDYHRPGA